MKPIVMPIAVRQSWGSRLHPLSIVIAFSSIIIRISAFFHFKSESLIICVFLLPFSLYLSFKYCKKASQTLRIDNKGLTHRFGRKEQYYKWANVTSLRRTGASVSGRDNYGIIVEYQGNITLSLNGSWSIPRNDLLDIFAKNCKFSTGKEITVSGDKVEYKNIGKLLLISGSVIFIPLFGLVYLSIILIRHHHG